MSICRMDLRGHLYRHQRRQGGSAGRRTQPGRERLTLQWTLTSYLLAIAALLLLAGALSERFGRRRVLVIGLPVSSALCGRAVGQR
ncbi:MAG: MFS transporter [Pseudonocardiaceae bacterium]